MDRRNGRVSKRKVKSTCHGQVMGGCDIYICMECVAGDRGCQGQLTPRAMRAPCRIGVPPNQAGTTTPPELQYKKNMILPFFAFTCIFVTLMF